MIYIALILILLVGISEAIMDKLQFHYSLSVFSKFNPLFWNPEISWKNKWKNGDNLQGEKFWLSSTLFVFTTDAWHLFKFFRNLFFFSAIHFVLWISFEFYTSLLFTIGLRVGYGAMFYIFYNFVLKIK